MRNSLAAILLATAAFGFSGVAQAEDRYSAEELVKFFQQSADLGASRGICIGTAAECDKKVKPVGLDMLINFELASDELTDEAQKNLNVFVKALKDERLKAAKFVVEGHTDASGSETYNESLAQRRAASVVEFITARGINEDKLVAIGMGERAPRTDNPLDAENRRVEMRISLQ